MEDDTTTTEPESLDIETAKSWMDMLGDVLKHAKEVASGSGISLNKLLVIFAGVFGYHKRYDVYKCLAGFTAMIGAVPLEKILDPTKDVTTGIFCRYSRLVRLLLPMMLFGGVISIIIIMCGFAEQTLGRMVLFSEVAVLLLALIGDFFLVFPLRKNMETNWINNGGAMLLLGRVRAYIGLAIATWMYVWFVVDVIGNGEPLNAILSGAYLLILGVIAAFTLLPICWLAYKASRISYANNGDTDDQSEKSFSDFFVRPPLRILFFVLGAVVTFKLIRIQNLPADYFFGAILALLVLSIAAYSNKMLRTFLRFITIKNMFIELGWVALLCLIAISTPSSGDRGTVMAAMQNTWNNVIYQRFVHSDFARQAGDVNGDLVTNEKDLWMMQAYIGFNGADPDPTAIATINLPWANVNGDGSVDDADLSLFMLAYPDTYDTTWDVNRDSLINDADLDRLEELVMFERLSDRDSVCGDVNYDFKVDETDIDVLKKKLERRSGQIRLALLQQPSRFYAPGLNSAGDPPSGADTAVVRQTSMIAVLSAPVINTAATYRQSDVQSSGHVSTTVNVSAPDGFVRLSDEGQLGCVAFAKFSGTDSISTIIEVVWRRSDLNSVAIALIEMNTRLRDVGGNEYDIMSSEGQVIYGKHRFFRPGENEIRAFLYFEPLNVNKGSVKLFLQGTKQNTAIAKRIQLS